MVRGRNRTGLVACLCPRKISLTIEHNIDERAYSSANSAVESTAEEYGSVGPVQRRDSYPRALLDAEAYTRLVTRVDVLPPLRSVLKAMSGR